MRDKKCYYDKKHGAATGTRVLPGVGAVWLCGSCKSVFESAARGSDPVKPATGPMGGRLKPGKKWGR